MGERNGTVVSKQALSHSDLGGPLKTRKLLDG